MKHRVVVYPFLMCIIYDNFSMAVQKKLKNVCIQCVFRLAVQHKKD